MPTLIEVTYFCQQQAFAFAKRLGRSPTPQELDDFADLLSRHREDFGLRRGPNTHALHLRRELCFAIFHRSVHPNDVPKPLGYLPGKILDPLFYQMRLDYERFWRSMLHGEDFPPQPGEAWEWLVSCALACRAGVAEWWPWIHSPVFWRHRHAPREFYEMLVGA